MDLQDSSLFFRTLNDVDVRLFANADLLSDACDAVIFAERPDCQVIISAICQPVAIVARILHSCNQIPLCERSDELVDARRPEARDLGDKRGGHNLVVLGALFECLQHPELVRGDVAQVGRVELHAGRLIGSLSSL